MCHSVLSVRKEQRSSHWADFHEIWCWGLITCQEIPNLVENRAKITDTLHKDLVLFIVAGDINLR